MECAACRRDTGKQHCFREMMFGTRNEFLYWECLTCGCLQIANLPEHLEEYYPSDYYAFTLEWPAWKRWYYRAHFLAPRLMNALRPCSKDVAFSDCRQADAQFADPGRGMRRGCVG